MPGIEAKAGAAYDFLVRLTQTADRPKPQWGVRWNDLKVAYHAYGGLNLVTKSVTSGDWTELGQGLYLLDFTAAELATMGEFGFVITANPAYATYDDYVGNIYLVDTPTETMKDAIDAIQTDATDIKQRVTGIQTTVSDVHADLVIVDTNVDTILTRANSMHAYLLGRIYWDFTTDPWTISVYDTDNTTLIASFSYTNTDGYEERRRL